MVEVSTSQRHAEFQFDFTGGSLPLDFANTVSHRLDPERRSEHLNGFDDLTDFARQAKIVSSRQAEELRAYSRRSGAETGRVFRRALNLREVLFRTLRAAAGGEPASPEDLERLEQFVAEALKHRRLARTTHGYRWEWELGAKAARLESILWPIAQAAGELLTSEELEKVRQCEAPDCEWLFLDISRNRSRRWCDMKTCGNREKARRHYHKRVAGY